MADAVFKGRHFAPALILTCVRWYCRYGVSYRDLEQMMAERGAEIDHTTIYRWVERYAPDAGVIAECLSRRTLRAIG